MEGPTLKSPEGEMDFHLIFEASPSPLLVLARDFNIVEVNQEYLKATMRSREDLLGKSLFEAFPDNPADPAATGVRNLRSSLEQVLRTGETDTMPLQKYDIPRPRSEGGFEERYWSPRNSPVVVNGEVKFIIHRVEDVTEFIRGRQTLGESAEEGAKWRMRAEQLQAEAFSHMRNFEQANANLQAAHEFSQTLLSSIKDGFLSVDRNWHLTYVNEQEAANLGATSSTLIGRSFWEVFPDPPTGEVHREMERAMEQRVAVEFEFYDARTCRWFEKRAYPSSQGISCLSTDVTARKRAEKRLEVSHSTAKILSKSHSIEEAWPELLPGLCSILEAQVAGLWLLNPERQQLVCKALHHCSETPEAIRFIEESKKIRLMGGESIPGRVWAEGQALYISDIESDSRLFRRELALRAGFRSAVAFPIRNGGEFFGVIEFFLNRFCPDDDSLLDIAASLGIEIGQFIQHKRAEAARVAAANELRRVWETVGTGLLHCSRDLRVLSANLAYEDLAGVAREQIVGRPLEEGIGKEGFEVIWPHVERVLKGERVEFEAEVPFASGARRHLHGVFTAEPDGQGQPHGWIASFNDVTERKRTEEALKAAQKQLQEYAAGLQVAVAQRTAELRESMAELEAFSYSLSHDMRAPLRAIQGFTQMVMHSCGDSLGAESKEYLAKVISAAQRLDRLIKDVLALTRVSRMDLPSATIALDDLLEGIISEHPEFHQPHAEIRVESPLLPVKAHEASLTQCLTNLLSNGVKFVPSGVTPRLRIWIEPQGEDVRLWIEDNGIGISQEDTPRLFQIFTRLHTESEFEGTGIGLAIVRRAVQRMGGSVGVESQPGNGSKFWIQLPGVYLG